MLRSVVGCDLFQWRNKGVRSLLLQNPESSYTHVLWRSGRQIAYGIETDGGFRVFAGGRARSDEVPSMPLRYLKLREDMKTDGRFVISENSESMSMPVSYVSTVDIDFSSKSEAAGVFLGRSANGRTEWQRRAESTGDLEHADGAVASTRVDNEGLTLWPYRLSSRDHEIAYGRDSREGFWIKAGSLFRIKESRSLSITYRDLRVHLLENEVVSEGLDGETPLGWLKFRQDHRFSSKSAAASAAWGSQINGKSAWVEWREEAAEPCVGGSRQNKDQSRLTGGREGTEEYGAVVLAACRLDDRELKTLQDSGLTKVGGLEFMARGTPNSLMHVDGAVVNRASHYPKSVQAWLWPEEDMSQAVFGVRRYVEVHDWEKLNNSDLSMLKPVRIEILIESRSDHWTATGGSPSSEASREGRLSAVIAIHLRRPIDEYGDLLTVLEDFIQGDEREEFHDFIRETVFRRHLGLELGAATELNYYPILLHPFSEDSEPTLESLCAESRLNPQRGGGQKVAGVGAVEEVLDGAPGEQKRRSEEHFVWNQVNGVIADSAVLSRSATVVVPQDESLGYAAATSSIYTDAIALAWIEHLSLLEFIDITGSAARKMLEVTKGNQSAEKLAQITKQFESVQRRYVENSLKYGKLDSLLRYRVSDLYGGMALKLKNEELRREIVDELERLHVLARLRHERVAEQEERGRVNREVTKRGREEKLQRLRDRRMQIYLGSGSLLIAIASLIEPIKVMVDEGGSTLVLSMIAVLLAVFVVAIVSVVVVSIKIRKGSDALTSASGNPRGGDAYQA